MNEKETDSMQGALTPTTSGSHTPINVLSTSEKADGEPSSTHNARADIQSNPEAATDGTSMTAADWNGPDDPENPQNWPLPKKLYHAGVTAMLSFVVTYGSSTYSPGIEQVADEFNVSKTVATLGLSLYVLGLALGPMLSAGLSETYGRRVVYIYCTPVSLLFTIGAGLSRGIASLLACRFLAGAIGAGPLAVGAGTNADIWKPIDRATGASIWILMPFLGPALGTSIPVYVLRCELHPD